MSIDEAIRQFKYDAECNRADLDLSYAEDNEQIAEWLEELKMYRESSYVELYSMVYNKAIDDAKSVILQTLDNEILVDTLHFRLEQLKGKYNE